MLLYLAVPFLVLVATATRADPAAYTSPATLDALWVSLGAATVATLLDALLGIPLGLWLATTSSRLRHAVTAAVILPLAVPPVVGGLELILLLGRNSLLGARLDAIGTSPVDSIFGTVLAEMFVAAPFVVITARAAFAGIDEAAVDAARVLGCGPLSLFTRVQVPLAGAGLAAGLVLGWIRCLGEFGATAVLAYHPYTLPTQTFVSLSGEGLRSALPPGLVGALVGAAAGGLALWLEARRRSGFPPADFSGKGTAGADLAQVDLGWIVPAPDGGAIAVDFQTRVGGFSLQPRFNSGPGLLVLLGASGAGKSLTTRVIAGLLRADGKVVVGGAVMQDSSIGVWTPPQERRIGYVAQRDGLFEHLDVRSNIEFGIRHLTREERFRRSEALLHGLQLAARSQARVGSLSGGERQRVALARALAPGPRALILDEAFSSLDVVLRRRLRRLVRDLQQRTGLPVLYVTHDRDDALDLADEVVILDRGTVIQQGSAGAVFRKPSGAMAAHLVGLQNLVPVGSVRTGAGRVYAVTEWGELEIEKDLTGETWLVLVPEDAIVPAGTGVEATVIRVRAGGNQTLVEVRSDAGLELRLALGSDADVQPGSRIKVGLRPGRYHVIPGAGGIAGRR